MPVLDKTPAGMDPEEFYTTLQGLTHLAVTPVEPRRLRIRLRARPTLYAMNGGLVSYSSADGGTLILRTWGTDATHLRRSLPGGMPPPLDIYYIGVPEDKARIALDVAAVWASVDRPYLEQTWRHFHGSPPPASTTLDRLRADYLDRVIAGDRQLLVEGGTAIGEAASVGGTPEVFEFVLRWTNAGGNALSPVPYIRLMPDEVYGGERWTAHPLIPAVASLPVPVDFYVKFEIWDLVDHRFVSLPEGITVELVDEDVTTTEVVGTQTTNADGVAHFGFARIEDLGTDVGGGGVDLFFRVRTSDLELPFAHHTSGLPDTWSTLGWLGRHAGVDIPGYYDDFRGTQIGAHDEPAVFRIGVDIHLRLRYFNSNGDNTGTGGRWEVAPLGFGRITVISHANPLLLVEAGSGTVDANGEVHLVSFAIGAGHDVSFRMLFQSREDTTIHFGTMIVAQLGLTGENVIYWNTDEDDEDRNNRGPTWFVENVKTSLGEHADPLDFTMRRDDKRVALNILKVYREWSVAVHRLTGGDWPGIAGYFLTYAPQASFSYPPGRVHIASNAHWYRPTMFHELSHQLMWHLVEPDVVVPFVVGLATNHGYQAHHRFRMVTNERTAFFEGWAEFMSKLLTGIREPFTRIFVDEDAVQASRTVELTSVTGQGNRIEGAFANALLDVWEHHVALAATDNLVETTNGDVMADPANAWLADPGVADGFTTHFWLPLAAVPAASPEPATMALRMRLAHLAEWHNLVVHFQRWNIIVPRLSTIAPATGPAVGGLAVDLGGQHFAAGSRVRIGTVTVPVADTTIRDEGRITFITPAHPAGAVDVKVIGPSGLETATLRFTYA